MQEDYLRILRYFRFYVRYGNLVDHDDEVLKAIEKCKDGLNSISGPRIWTELKKILSYQNSLNVLDLIFNQLKLGVYMGFNENLKSIDRVVRINENLKRFNEFVNKSNEQNLNDDDKKLNYLSLIASLLDDQNELENLRKRLSLSNQELFTTKEILNYREIDFDYKDAKKRIVLTPKSEKDRKKAWLLEVFKYKGDLDSYLSLKNQPIPVFPNIGKEIQKRLKDKSQVGLYIGLMIRIWIDSDYKMTSDELIVKFNESYDKLKESNDELMRIRDESDKKMSLDDLNNKFYELYRKDDKTDEGKSVKKMKK